MQGLIGLEIHTYLVTKEKLFCRCSASRERGLEPNVNVCPTCTGQPGAKPFAPNSEAVKMAVKIGLMLGCKINNRMKWMRKHYSWPDLPKGYQTTMSGAHATPLGIDGAFENIRISSMHLEEDPASWEPQTGRVDYNRSGLPLVEIVTAPEFHFSEEVVEWLHKLVHALAYLKVADTNAGIKVDVNVNLISPKKTERVEIKNITSIEAIGKAITYELERQSQEGSVRETRRFDEAKSKTVSMRSKEKEDDYRFIAEPDLQDVVLDKNIVNELKENLPELPEVKLKKLITKHKIDKKNAEVLAKNIDIAEFFEKVVKDGGMKADFALHWITGELLRVLNWNKKMLHEVDIKAEHFIELLKMVEKRAITELQAKEILNKFVPKSFSPSNAKGKISDRKDLEIVVKKIIENNQKAAEAYRKGDEKILNYLMGEVMKATQRRADYKIARAMLEKMLKAR
ncbi:MAG TPA: Asp-tRNA(Asn)/Glu-tRNA(Gln) amidotransferase subunit GatB [Candidatus Nanoarchaeia archaeon]|nr:Asp-tRNA(Asn)/Glu-tRNA(Gln) amidotransferase subunit GatB [Candidatus Nanoarchaeia archaeon]